MDQKLETLGMFEVGVYCLSFVSCRSALSALCVCVIVPEEGAMQILTARNNIQYIPKEE